MNGVIEWTCPSNIALVKYWGKRPGQIPSNPSLSFALSESVTRLQLEYDYNISKQFSVEFYFNNLPDHEFGQRVQDYLYRVMRDLPELEKVNLRINSSNTFPHSAGIASSASAFGALALALSSMTYEIRGISDPGADFFKQASSLARVGSGSACRSVYGGYVAWGVHESVPGSSDDYATPIPDINPEFRYMRDSILVVSSETKAISSSKGHLLMNENIFASQRRIQAFTNLQKMLSSLAEGALHEFICILENEALTLHAMMMTSSPGYILMKPASLEIIEKVRNFRIREGIPAAFTLDAGPNVHLLYPPSAENTVRKFIDSELKMHCENIIHDFAGKGPERTK